MVCRNWEFQWVLPVFSCKVWIKSVQYFIYDCYACMCVSINPFVYLKSQYYFLFVSYVFTFSSSVLQLLIYKIFCLKINILLYCISQIYLSTNFIYMYVKYYQFFKCFVLCVLFASPFTSAWRYREISWSTEWSN